MAAPYSPSATYSFSSYPLGSSDSEVQQLRTRILSYIQARVCSGERYSETKLAREAGIAQQTLNDLLRGKTASVTRLTRTKLIDFLENNPPAQRAFSNNIGPAAALMMLRRSSAPACAPGTGGLPSPTQSPSSQSSGAGSPPSGVLQLPGGAPAALLGLQQLQQLQAAAAAAGVNQSPTSAAPFSAADYHSMLMAQRFLMGTPSVLPPVYGRFYSAAYLPTPGSPTSGAGPAPAQAAPSPAPAPAPVTLASSAPAAVGPCPSGQPEPAPTA